MEKWELLDGLEETKEGLERIVGIIDTDFLNRHVIEGVIVQHYTNENTPDWFQKLQIK